MSTAPSASAEPSAQLQPLPARVLSLPDDEMLDWLGTWWIAAQAEAKGIPREHISPQLRKLIWRETLTASTDSVTGVALLQVMKDIALGNRGRAAKMFREFMMAGAIDHVLFERVATSIREQEAYSRKQSERAKKDRGDPLTEVIRPWVEQDKNISTKEVVRRLRALGPAGHDAIRDVTADVVVVAEQKDGEEVFEDIRISSLPSRISRLRKK